MEEKKLTDKEMDCLHDIYISDCETCHLFDEPCPLFDEDCNTILPKALKELIHRLQSENERLTKENKKLSIKVWNYEQPARTPLYSNESMVNCNLVTCYNENADLKAKTAELQKQVDELNKYKEFVDACKLGADIEIVMNRIKPYAILREKTHKQAVKDTAKEILLSLIDCEKQIDPLKTGIRWSVLKGFCKKYGVEVE